MARGAPRGRPARGRAAGQNVGGKRSARGTTADVTVASGGKRRRAGGESGNSDSGDDVALVYQLPPRRRSRGGGASPWDKAHPRQSHTSAGSSVQTTSRPTEPAPSVRGGNPHLSAAAAGGGDVAGPMAAQQQQSHQHSMRLGKDKTPAEVLLWRRCMSQRNLLRSLENCGLAPAPRDEADAAADVGKGAAIVDTLFALGEDRIRTAIQCLLDLKALAIYVPDDGEHGTSPLTPLPAAAAAAGTSGDSVATSTTKRLRKSAAVAHRSVAPADGMRGGGWWVEQPYFGAVMALAGLCDAAVPTVFPALVAPDAPALAQYACELSSERWQAGAASEPATVVVVVVPLPVSMVSVRERLRSLTRIWQLRFTYGLLSPVLHRCQSVACLNEFFLPSQRVTPPSSLLPVAEVDTFVAFPALSSTRHRAEGLVLGELVARASSLCKLDVDSWGPMAVLPTLKVAAGVYVVQHTSRQATLAALLAEEADLYGLPLFLRSIRRTTFALGAGGGRPTGLASSTATAAAAGGGGVRLPSTLGEAAAMDYTKEHLLFPSLCSLDFRRFTVPDAMQAPLVQEELVGLALKHCAFGLLVGEADQITTLLKEWSEHRVEGEQRQQRRRQWEATQAALKREEDGGVHGGVPVKEEGEREDGTAGRGAVEEVWASPRRRDPMAPFVRETAVRAREVRRDAPPSTTAAENSGADVPLWRRLCHVEWLCDNRWAPAETRPSYYGLVFGVVLQSDLLTTVLDGATPSAPVDADQGGTGGRGEGATFREVTYYLSAVVELTR